MTFIMKTSRDPFPRGILFLQEPWSRTAAAAEEAAEEAEEEDAGPDEEPPF